MKLINLIIYLISQVIWPCEQKIANGIENSKEKIPHQFPPIESIGISWSEIMNTFAKAKTLEEPCIPECESSEICQHGICLYKIGYFSLPGQSCFYVPPQSVFRFLHRFF